MKQAILLGITKFLGKNWKNVLLIVLIITLVLIIYFRIRKKDEQDIDNEIRKDIQRTNPGANDFQLVSDASSIYKAFGLDASWWNPSNWTEDEEAVIGILKRYNQNSFALLQDVYYRKYSRYLEGDIRDYFRESQLEQIAHLL